MITEDLDYQSPFLSGVEHKISPLNDLSNNLPKLETRRVTQQQALNELIIGASVTSSGSFRWDHRYNNLEFPNFKSFARSLSGESLPETGEPRELTQEVAVV